MKERPHYAWHKTLYQQGFTAFPVVDLSTRVCIPSSMIVKTEQEKEVVNRRQSYLKNLAQGVYCYLPSQSTYPDAGNQHCKTRDDGLTSAT